MYFNLFRRMRRQKLWKGCVFISVVFLIYQLIFFIVLTDQTNSNSVHPRDIHSIKANALNKNSKFNILHEKKVKTHPETPYLPHINGAPKQLPLQQPLHKHDVTSDKTFHDTINNGVITKEPPSLNAVVKTFKCEPSGIIIEATKVNDDYCDCPDDGSDEPLTNACPNGVFVCENKSRGFPSKVPSGFVNDGVCDCCDGSDEKISKTKCLNMCPHPG